MQRDATKVGIHEEVVGYIAECRRPQPHDEPTLFGYEVGRLSDAAIIGVGLLAAIFCIAVCYVGFLLLVTVR